jgi:glycosyltransferase involved in cell wall biosynthesis
MSGKMSYHANVTMALHLVQEIMPHVWAQQPETRVCIVGKDPSRAIQDLSRNPNIIVTGTVSDVRPYLRKATIAVAPIAYGVGIQNKVLEAMACATPVVATPQAVSALNLQAGEDALVAQKPADFAQAILRLLNDRQLREKVGQRGRRYVEANHDWAAVSAQLEQTYRQVRISDSITERSG